MRKSRFTEEQIVSILKQAEAGERISNLTRRRRITETTFYRWKKKHGGMQVHEAKRLKRLEEGNRRLKKLVADLAIDLQVLKELLGKEW